MEGQGSDAESTSIFLLGCTLRSYLNHAGVRLWSCNVCKSSGRISKQLGSWSAAAGRLSCNKLRGSLVKSSRSRTMTGLPFSERTSTIKRVNCGGIWCRRCLTEVQSESASLLKSTNSKFTIDLKVLAMADAPASLSSPIDVWNILRPTGSPANHSQRSGRK